MMAGTPQRQRGPRARRSRRFWRALSLAIFATGVASVLGLWIAVNRVEWLGPYVADGLRAVIGVDAVASLEDFSYRVQDRINRVWRSGEKPRAYWSVPSARPRPEPPKPKAPGVVAAAPLEPELPPFALAKVGPVHKEWSAPGDGEWLPMGDNDRPDDPVMLMKTLLHPDKSRSWA